MQYRIRLIQSEEGWAVSCPSLPGCHSQGETLEELREMVRDAVHCHFGDGVPGKMPSLIRLHFVRDEVLAP